ncbi:MAG TPA: hypothetical protein VFA18_19120 [Gemmataceae bacterium]|nr:hypothetical protein [Gemmataceae bacterium]
MEFFWKISAQRSEHEPLPGQGIYVVTPGGKLLAYRQRDHDPNSIAAMLSAALEQWKALPDRERHSSSQPRSARPKQHRSESKPPEDGLVLEVFVRDLPRKPGSVEPKLARMWNHDYAWFTQEEVRSMLPAASAPGHRFRVLDRLVRRLVRLHLLDSVRGINDARPFADKDVKKAEMFMTVVKKEGDILYLKIEGATRAVEPPLADAVGSGYPDGQERGYEAKLLGRATVNVRDRSFLAFKLVAMGSRWGGRGHTHSMRKDDVTPQPMGFAFRLVPPSAVTATMVPHYAANYFTR